MYKIYAENGFFAVSNGRTRAYLFPTYADAEKFLKLVLKIKKKNESK